MAEEQVPVQEPMSSLEKVLALQEKRNANCPGRCVQGNPTRNFFPMLQKYGITETEVKDLFYFQKRYKGDPKNKTEGDNSVFYVGDKGQMPKFPNFDGKWKDDDTLTEYTAIHALESALLESGIAGQEEGAATADEDARKQNKRSRSAEKPAARKPARYTPTLASLPESLAGEKPAASRYKPALGTLHPAASSHQALVAPLPPVSAAAAASSHMPALVAPPGGGDALAREREEILEQQTQSLVKARDYIIGMAEVASKAMVAMVKGLSKEQATTAMLQGIDVLSDGKLRRHVANMPDQQMQQMTEGAHPPTLMDVICSACNDSPWWIKAFGTEAMFAERCSLYITDEGALATRP
jgi:hypothetical protein